MKKKIFWISQLIIAAALLFYSLFSTQVFYNNFLENTGNTLKTYINLFDSALYSFDGEGAEAFSEKLSGARVCFFDLNGDLLADSALKGEGNHADREEIRQAVSKGEGSAVRRSDSFGEDMIYYCRKLEESKILVRISLPAFSQWQAFKETLPMILWILALDFIVCLPIVYLSAGYIIDPVKKLAKDALHERKIAVKHKELQPIADILNRRNTEIEEQFKALSEEKELVERAQQSKNDFIANITHEMNTPLTSIHGYSELMASGVLEGEEVKTAAATLVKQSDRLSKLIACIINYNELDNDCLPVYEVNLSKLAEETLELLSPDIVKREIVLEKKIEGGMVVMSRHERLSEVLGNLIRNAIRYNKTGGKLTVEICRTERGGKLIVADTGVGIAEENIDRIFDRFFTVDKSHSGKNGGFGLGLAVVKKICQKAGWKLEVESKLGEGTTFTVEF